jgi:Family of unknown function (DUF5723)
MILALLLMCPLFSYSQSDMLLYNLKSVPQSTYTNPGIIPRSSYAIGLPFISSFYNKYFNNAFTTNELLKSRAADDSLVVDIPGILPGLKNMNQFSEYSSIDLIFAGIKVKRGYFSFSIQNKAFINISYPKQLAEFLWYGNGKYLGQTLNFNDFRVNLQHYLSYNFAYAFQVDRNFSLGARIKVLHGLSNINFKKMQASVTTTFDENNLYVFKADNDIEVNTSGIESFELGAGSGFSVGDYLKNKNNSGFGLDFGFDWKISPSLNLSCSIIDLGYLYWISDVKNYTTAESKIVFDGVNVDLSQNVNAIDVYLDSLNSIFSFNQTEKSYFTSLPTRVNLAANYELSYMTNIGFLYQARIIDNYTQNAFCLSFDRLMTRNFTLKVAWSAVNNTYDNFGVGAVLDLGPVQTYFLTENIVSLLSPLDARNHSFRFGIIINVFKRKDREQMDGIKNDYPNYQTPFQNSYDMKNQMNDYWERKNKKREL